MRWRDDVDDTDDDEGDDVDEDDDATVPCPHCFRAVYEDAERCPGCGHYLSNEDAPERHPLWLILGVVICLGVVAGWVLR